MRDGAEIWGEDLDEKRPTRPILTTARFHSKAVCNLPRIMSNFSYILAPQTTLTPTHDQPTTIS